jgi:hypothetical protein
MAVCGVAHGCCDDTVTVTSAFGAAGFHLAIVSWLVDLFWVSSTSWTPFHPSPLSFTSHTPRYPPMPTTRSATAAASGTAPKPSSTSKPPASPMRPSVKRSASIASLPTPPQTLHKRRGRGRAHAPVEPIAEEPEEGDLPAVEPPTRSTRSKSRNAVQPVEVKHGRKRQRVDFGPSLCDDDDAVDAPADDANKPSDIVTKPTVEVEEAEEDAFWLDKPSPKKGQSSTMAEPPSPGGLLDQPNRVKVRAPVSPPPSRHRPRPPVTPKAKASGSLFLVAPVTPPRRTLRSGPVRDSGNNPFLEESPGSQLTLSPPNPLSPTPHAEPATLTYVLYVFLIGRINIILNLSVAVAHVLS